MKKSIVVIGLLLLLTIGSSYAQEVNVSVKLNDEYLKVTKSSLLIENRTYIIAKDLVKALEGDIQWHAEKRMVEINYNDHQIKFYVDSNRVENNGEILALDVKPFIREGRTYIPLRYVSEYLGCEVTWDADTYTVALEKPTLDLKEEYIDKNHYTAEDLKWLSKIVQVESSDGSMAMKLAIANVVLNRVKDSRFPNTVKDVIFQVDVYVQFPPAHKDSFKSVKPSINSLIAAKNALEGKNNIDTCLFFNNRPFKSKADDLYKIIDGEYFYY